MFFTSPILEPFVFATRHNFNTVYAYKTEEDSVIVQVHVIV